MRFFSISVLVIVVTVAAGFRDGLAQTIIYVDSDAAAGADNGTSWTDAFLSLQDALAAAVDGDVIRVASGTYRPDQGVNQTLDHPNETFQLENGVSILGGYAGVGEPNPDDRDVVVYETILTGEIGTGSVTDNSTHVITGSSVHTSARLDGFTIVNSADSGMHNDAGSPTVVDCTFRQNRGSPGGAVNNENGSSPLFQECTFRQHVNASRGGAVYNLDSSPMFENCLFEDNSSTLQGGAIYNTGNSDPTFADCTFRANHSVRGGAITNSRASCTLLNCDFIDNQTSGFGAAIYNDRVRDQFSGQVPLIRACTFIGNIADGSTGGGAGVYSSRSHPLIDDCMFIGNRAGPNGSTLAPGGAIQNSDSNAIVMNCAFIGNTASSRGGAIGSFSGSPSFVNCLFSGNRVEANLTDRDGGGLHIVSGTALVLNCTFSENNATNNGGGLWISSADSTVSNCIFWNNADLGGTDESAQIFIDGSSPSLGFLCVQGLSSLTGAGHTGLDPLFRDADGVDDIVGTEDDDLRLQPGSPCIDAGDNTAVPPDAFDLDGDTDTVEPIPFDATGDLRFRDDPDTADTGNPDGVNSLIDMGAHEFRPVPVFLLGDLNCDGSVSGLDITPFVQALLDPSAYAGAFSFCNIDHADMNQDTLIDTGDIAPLVEALVGTVPGTQMVFTTYPNGQKDTNEAISWNSNTFTDFPDSWFVVWQPVVFLTDVEVTSVRTVVGQGGLNPDPPNPALASLRIVDTEEAARDFNPIGENGPNYEGHEIFSMVDSNPAAEDFVPFGTTGGDPNYEYGMDSLNVFLPAGTYWFSFVWHDTFGISGQYGPIVVEENLPPDELTALQIRSIGFSEIGRTAITITFNDLGG
ncbi:MAG: hypothetical protein MI923_19680 [Phycisphaerales bacterium]|nr:hypothetical protein [Phycisphaerales bacterium]